MISIPGSVLPGHAALDLVDGKERLQVEPTNPDGFDWKTKSSRPGVIVIGYVPDRKNGHEVDALGIPAMIYSNRGVSLGKAGDRLAAARCYLAALAADPTDGTAGNNLLAVFGNWGPELVKEKKFEEAVRVMGFAQGIAAKDDQVRTNATFVWEHYIDWLLDEKKDAEAVAAVRRAAKAVGRASMRGVVSMELCGSCAAVRVGRTCPARSRRIPPAGGALSSGPPPAYGRTRGDDLCASSMRAATSTGKSRLPTARSRPLKKG